MRRTILSVAASVVLCAAWAAPANATAVTKTSAGWMQYYRVRTPTVTINEIYYCRNTVAGSIKEQNCDAWVENSNLPRYNMSTWQFALYTNCYQEGFSKHDMRACTKWTWDDMHSTAKHTQIDWENGNYKVDGTYFAWWS